MFIFKTSIVLLRHLSAKQQSQYMTSLKKNWKVLLWYCMTIVTTLTYDFHDNELNELKHQGTMNKVVYNVCFGGFSISKAAMEWLAENGREEIKTIAKNELQKNPNNNFGYHCREIQRHDPDLVRCVETLRHAAAGRYANLQVRELKGNRYRIDDYDGNEEVYEPEEEKYITIK
jgi:hypothetical protein